MGNKQVLFKQIGQLYLKMRLGLMNNNMSFDHLMQDLIRQIETQFNASISKVVLYNQDSLKTIFKYWMSVYGILYHYGYTFVLIGYLANDFEVISAPDFNYQAMPQVNPEMAVDLMGMLVSLKKEVLNQDPLQLQKQLQNDVLGNCVLNLDTKKQLDDNLFLAQAPKILDQIKFLKQAYENNPSAQTIIVDTLLKDLLQPENPFYQVLQTFQVAHNHYAQFKNNDLVPITVSDDDLENTFQIVQTIIDVLDHSDIYFKGLIFKTSLDTNQIVDVRQVLVNNSLALALLQQYQPEFNLFDDVFYPIGGMTVSFQETSLAQYVNAVPGINLLYQYTHISYLAQCELAVYLEQSIHQIPMLYLQTIHQNRLDFDPKVFTSLNFQLRKLLKDFYATVIKYMNSINQGSLEMGAVVYSSFLDLDPLVEKVTKN